MYMYLQCCPFLSLQMTGYMFRNAEYRRSLKLSLAADSLNTVGEPSGLTTNDGPSDTSLPPIKVRNYTHIYLSICMYIILSPTTYMYLQRIISISWGSPAALRRMTELRRLASLRSRCVATCLYIYIYMYLYNVYLSAADSLNTGGSPADSRRMTNLRILAFLRSTCVICI